MNDCNKQKNLLCLRCSYNVKMFHFLKKKKLDEGSVYVLFSK